MSARTARPVRQVTVVATALVGAFVLARIGSGLSIGGFVLAGDHYVDPDAAPAELPVLPDSGGYDGQFVYRLALAPWSTDSLVHGIRFDMPAYRHQRIATGALAWALSGLPGVSTALALLLVNALSLVAAARYATRIAVHADRHPALGLVLAFPACVAISLGRDLTEPLAWAAVLAGIWYARRGQWGSAAAALTLGVLARETSLLVVAGLGAGELLRWAIGHSRPGRATEPGSRRAWWLAVPVVVVAGWQLLLWQAYGSPPLAVAQSGNLADLPVLGVLKSTIPGLTHPVGSLTDNPAVRFSWELERLGLLLIIGCAAVSIVRRRSRVSAGEQIAWLLAVGLALSLRGWTYDVQFLRASSEALGLSVLVALGDPGRAGRLALTTSAAMSAGVAAVFVLVP